jgi:CelD/BcsL family acetyltransferase involved in cellulose biosynthesis
MSLTASLLPALPDAADWPTPPAGEGIPMQSHAWCHARAELVPTGELVVPAVHDGDGVRALALLAQDGERLREAPLMFEPSDLAWHDTDSLDVLAAALVRQGRPFELERLPAQSPTLAALRRALGKRDKILVEAAMPTPYIGLEGADPDIDACFNARRRSDFRRAARRAAGRGTLDYQVLTPADDDELLRLLDDAYAIETQSWKYAAGTALTADEMQGMFIARFAQGAMRDGCLRLLFLRIAGKPVAMQLATEWQQRFWLFKMSYDKEYARCSPGQLLLRHALRHAAARGLRSLEFMGVMDNWTRQWTDTTRRYLRVEVMPHSTATLKMAAKQRIRGAWRQLRQLVE